MRETPSLLLLLFVLLIEDPSEPPLCQADYEIPPEISEMIQEEKDKGGIIEIQEKSPTGYISSLFYGRLLLEGLFYLDKDGKVVICEITNATRAGKDMDEEEGAKPTFTWFENQQKI